MSATESEPVMTTGPSAEGAAMDKLRCIANGERRHIGVNDARAINDLFEALNFRLRAMVRFYDEHSGTPCAQIRWQQEREEIAVAERERLAKLWENDGDEYRGYQFADWLRAL